MAIKTVLPPNKKITFQEWKGYVKNYFDTPSFENDTECRDCGRLTDKEICDRCHEENNY